MLTAELVPGTAAILRRRQSMKPQVEVKSMNHRPSAAKAAYSSTWWILFNCMDVFFGKVFNAVVVAA